MNVAVVLFDMNMDYFSSSGGVWIMIDRSLIILFDDGIETNP